MLLFLYVVASQLRLGLGTHLVFVMVFGGYTHGYGLTIFHSPFYFSLRLSNEAEDLSKVTPLLGSCCMICYTPFFVSEVQWQLFVFFKQMYEILLVHKLYLDNVSVTKSPL